MKLVVVEIIPTLARTPVDTHTLTYKHWNTHTHIYMNAYNQQTQGKQRVYTKSLLNFKHWILAYF